MSTIIKNKFNSKLLAKDLLKKREADNLSTRKAAKAAKVSPAAFNFIEAGRTPAVDILAKLCNWLGVPVQTYF